jgi:phosphoglycolate phosphatase-like HAD superfamily hydrolase
MDYQAILKNLKPEREYFIGIDSDGCVFDTMEVKQKEFFIPNALKYFNLFSISKILRETWEFVNLYSVFRGGNRFASIINVFELLSERKEFNEISCKLPDLTSLKEWINGESRLGNSTLRKYFESNYNPELEKVLLWSEAVNEDIGKWLRNIPPFPHARSAVKNIASFADIIVVSQTPIEALDREWEEHDLKEYVKIIAGLEHGTKSDHIAMAAKGKYADNKIMMIGDADGDLNAAKNNGVLFYPILPGGEDKSWERLQNEGLARFINNTFKGAYEDQLHREFRKLLPEKPSWRMA